MAEDRPVEELVDAVVYGEIPLRGLDDVFEELRARINLVCVVSPELGFPDLGYSGFRSFLEQILTGIESPETVDASLELQRIVGGSKLRWLDEIVPSRWIISGEQKIKLRYSLETDPSEGHAIAPEADVRIADLLDVDEHPFVCEGRVAVRLWLRDPKGKRLDSTFDWPVFREGEYQSFKDDLTRKFPEVDW